MVYLDDETIVYHGLDHTWRYDVANMKKKRFFSNKEENSIIDMVAKFFDIPKKCFSNYHSSWTRIRLAGYKNERVFFECDLFYHHNSKECETELHGYIPPSRLRTLISCNRSAKDIKIEADKVDIERVEKPRNTLKAVRSLYSHMLR